MPIRKFPAYLTNAQHENPNIDADEEFTQLFLLDQGIDYIKALQYAESALLSRDITSITAQEFEIIINALHSIVAYHLILLTGSGRTSGQYAQTPTYVTKETGIPDYHYFPDLLSDANAVILAKKYDATAVAHYKNFVAQLNAYIEQQTNQCTSLEQTYYWHNIPPQEIIERASLETHPGYPYYLETVALITAPRDIPQRMRTFYQKLYQLIQTKQSPFKIAAHALSLAKEHPYLNGDGRVARILLYCVFLAYNIYPPNLNQLGEKKQQYYAAIESDDPNALETFLKTYCHIQSYTEEELKVAFPPTELLALFEPESQTMRCVYPTAYHYVAKDRWDAYSRFASNYMGLVMALSKTSVSALKKSTNPMVAQLQQFATAYINAASCMQRAASLATQPSTDNQKAAAYYYVHAGDFYFNSGDIKQCVTQYLSAATIYINLDEFDGAYDLAQRVLRISHQQKISSQYTTEANNLLQSLNFVKQYRDSLVATQPTPASPPVKKQTYAGLRGGFLSPKQEPQKPAKKIPKKPTFGGLGPGFLTPPPESKSKRLATKKSPPQQQSSPSPARS